MNKLPLIAAFFLIISLVPVAAKMGVAISPGAGEFKISESGGNLQFVVFNSGDEDLMFSIKHEGDCAPYVEFDRCDCEIVAGGYETFSARITPPENMESCKLSVTASSSPEKIEGSGAAVGAAAQATVTLKFSSSGTQSIASVAPTYTPPESLLTKVMRSAPMLIAVTILIVLTYFAVIEVRRWYM